MAQIPADPLAWGAPAGSVEVLGWRQQHAKHFRHPDGTNTSVFGAVIHYEPTPGGGAWEDADTLFRPSGSDQVADHLPFSVTQSGRSLTLVDRASGRGIAYTLPPVGLTISGNTLSFDWNGGAWVYTVTPAGVKLAVTIASSRGLQHYQLPYARVGGAAAMAVLPDGSVQGDGFVLPAPLVIGADGVRYGVGAWTLGANFLEFDWDDTALPPEAYPYALDPTTTFTSTATLDGYAGVTSSTVWPPVAGASGGTSDVSAISSVYAQKANFGSTFAAYVGLMRWDTSSLPDNCTVTGAVARVTFQQAASPDARNFRLEWYVGTATIVAADYTVTDSGTAYGGSLITGFSLASNDITLLAPDANVSRTGTTGLRSHVSGGSPTGINTADITSVEVTPAPQLLVTWTVAPPPPRRYLTAVRRAATW